MNGSLRLLLVQRGRYLPSHLGAQKANRSLMQALVARGCRCAVWTVLQGDHAEQRSLLLSELHAAGLAPTAAPEGHIAFSDQGVNVFATGTSRSWRRQLARVIDTWKPTWILVADDWTYSLLEACIDLSSRAVWIAHNSVLLPLGPFVPRSRERDLLRRAAGVVTVSDFMRRRIEHLCAREPLVLHFPVYGPTLPEPRGGWAAPFVTMVNPSGIKGIDVFLGLAERLPGTRFAAVPSWATNARDLQRLSGLPNMRLLERSADIGEILSVTRALLVPSLWQEAFGQVAIDAMLRGVPVIASNVGGLPEAKLGVEYVVDVRPIATYREEFDDLSLPLPEVPEQNLGLWLGPLRALLSDQTLYTDVARRSLAAARAYWSRISVDPLLRYLSEIPLPA